MSINDLRKLITEGYIKMLQTNNFQYVMYDKKTKEIVISKFDREELKNDNLIEVGPGISSRFLLKDIITQTRESITELQEVIE